MSEVNQDQNNEPEDYVDGAERVSEVCLHILNKNVCIGYSGSKLKLVSSGGNDHTQCTKWDRNSTGNSRTYSRTTKNKVLYITKVGTNKLRLRRHRPSSKIENDRTFFLVFSQETQNNVLQNTDGETMYIGELSYTGCLGVKKTIALVSSEEEAFAIEEIQRNRTV